MTWGDMVHSSQMPMRLASICHIPPLCGAELDVGGGGEGILIWILHNKFTVPTGGCNRPPFPSHHPTGWISFESTRCQTSFALSVPSNRHLILGPNMPTTVATHMVSTILGSATSNFMLLWKPLYGGTWAYVAKKKKKYKIQNIIPKPERLN